MMKFIKVNTIRENRKKILLININEIVMVEKTESDPHAIIWISRASTHYEMVIKTTETLETIEAKILAVNS